MWFLLGLAASASEEPQPGAYPSSGSVPVIFSNPKWALESELQSLDYPPDAEAPGCAAPTAAKAAYPQAELPLRSWTFPDQGGSDCPWAGQTGGLALILEKLQRLAARRDEPRPSRGAADQCSLAV